MNKINRLWLAFLVVLSGCATVASSPHFTVGTRALERGDYQTAAKELEEAVRLEPRVSRYHNNLAFAPFKLNEEPKGWFHLRQAVLLDPSNRQAVASFGSYWAHLERSGKVQVGANAADVLAALGEPDITLKSEAETSYIWGVKRVIVRSGKVAVIEVWVK